ncbi:MAG TPA: diguanylate cyclase [Limnochordales bacterium]
MLLVAHRGGGHVVVYQQAVIGALVMVLLVPLWMFLNRHVLRPLQQVVEADRRPGLADLQGRLIDEQRIPDHEVGDVIRSRNQLLRQIDEVQSQFRRNLKHLGALSSAAVRLLEAGELQGFLEQVLDRVMDAVGADAAEVSLFQPTQGQFVTRVRRTRAERPFSESHPEPEPGCPCRQVLDSRQPYVANGLPAGLGPHGCRLDGFQAYLGVPLLCSDRALGVLAAMRRHHPFAPAETDTLMAIGYLVALALEHARLHEATLQLAITDELTGLYTRRYFFERLEEEARRARRLQRPFSVIMLDLDRFKECNDRFGHLAGDEVLRQVGRRLAAVVRQSDVVARYGGDEFVVLLPETGKEEAGAVARRLCQCLAFQCETQATWPHPVDITASLGVASFPEDADTPHGLLARADTALYEAKSRGGSSVCVYGMQAAGCPRRGGVEHPPEPAPQAGSPGNLP